MTKKRKPLQNKDPRLCDKKLKLLEKERLNKNEVGELLAFDSQESGLDSSGEESTDSKNENALAKQLPSTSEQSPKRPESNNADLMDNSDSSSEHVYECSHCGKTYDVKNDLVHHLISNHSNEKKEMVSTNKCPEDVQINSNGESFEFDNNSEIMDKKLQKRKRPSYTKLLQSDDMTEGKFIN